GPSGDDLPGAHERPEAADDLLLQGDLDGEQWQERWRGEPCQPVHHTRPRRANTSSPPIRSRCESELAARRCGFPGRKRGRISWELKNAEAAALARARAAPHGGA